LNLNIMIMVDIG